MSDSGISDKQTHQSLDLKSAPGGNYRSADIAVDRSRCCVKRKKGGLLKSANRPF
jgi:hypothetical protein